MYLQDKIVEKFREVCTNLCECLQAAFEPLWTTTESSKQMRSSLFESKKLTILEMLDTFILEIGNLVKDVCTLTRRTRMRANFILLKCFYIIYDNFTIKSCGGLI